MICLGIETTAHTASLSIVDDKGRIIFENRDMYTREDGGIIPSDAALHHKKIFPLLGTSMSIAGNWIIINGLGKNLGLSHCCHCEPQRGNLVNQKTRSPRCGSQ